LVAFACAWLLLIVCIIFRVAVGGWSERLDGLFLFLGMCVAGRFITELARNYGIEKTGWLGVGAKTVITLFVLQGLIGAVVAAVALNS
jgi:hypothetical protein